MRIVIAGAKSSIGRELVPLMQHRGVDILVVDDDVVKLQGCFPNIEVAGYDAIATKGVGADLFVHFSTRDENAEPENASANVLAALAKAREAGISRFLNVSNIDALESAARYERVDYETMSFTTVYVPSVVGETLSGELVWFGRLPPTLRHVLLSFWSSWHPVVRVDRVADFFVKAASMDRMPITEILTDGQQANPVFLFSKRLIDLLFAASVIVFFGWALIVIWVWVRLDSPGPGIFSQARVGKDGKEFICYKFRTMKVDTIQAATHEVHKSSVTSLGAFLRKSKIDELPQVFNILMNQLSLVGPRPCLPTQIDLVDARRANGSLSLKPGITGLGQVNKVDMSEPLRLAELDSRYGRLQSLALDIRIILATALGRGGGDNIAG